MSITNIVILITLLLVVSVIASIIFTKKEQAATQKRQQVAGFRYKADEAQDLYDGLQKAGLEKITYQFLLTRIVINLQAAFNIDAKAPGIKLRLNSAKNTLETLDTITFYIEIPSAMTELHGLVGRLNKLVKYLVVLFQKRMIDETQYQQIMPAVQRTLLKFDAEGHIKVGHQAANDGQPGTAKQCYLHAKEKLLSFGTEDSYITAQLEKVEELIASLSGDDVRPPAPTGPTATAIDEQIPQEVLDTQEVPDTQEQQEADLTQEELNRMSESDGEFTPKKKW